VLFKALNGWCACCKGRGIKMRAKFYMERDEYGGVNMIYITSRGNKSSTYFPGSPEDIDHVCIDYMKKRFTNVRTLKQVEFIKRKYKEAYRLIFGAMKRSR
jgi:hypothetical protein